MRTLSRRRCIFAIQTVAVELHQQTLRSTDIRFDLALTATVLPAPENPGLPVGDRRRLIVSNAVGLRLFRREVLCHVNRHVLKLELQGGLVACVPHHDHALGVHDDRLSKTELLNRPSHRVNGRVVRASDDRSVMYSWPSSLTICMSLARNFCWTASSSTVWLTPAIRWFLMIATGPS